MKTWVIADPHFSHWGVCKFLAKDGVSKLRPWDNPDDMDEALIENWNSVVEKQDRVYVLGDVAMTKKPLLKVLPRLKGRLVLVKGNHDVEKMNVYNEYFDDIRAYVVKKGLIMSHIPIHPDSLGRWQFNIHGHLHDGVVRKQGPLVLDDGCYRPLPVPDPRYICVSVEQTNYTPVDLQTIIDRLDPNWNPR